MTDRLKTVYPLKLRFAGGIKRGAWWHSGRASDSESRGPGFDPHKRHRVVSLSKTH